MILVLDISELLVIFIILLFRYWLIMHFNLAMAHLYGYSRIMVMFLKSAAFQGATLIRPVLFLICCQNKAAFFQITRLLSAE